MTFRPFKNASGSNWVLLGYFHAHDILQRLDTTPPDSSHIANDLTKINFDSTVDCIVYDYGVHR